MNNHFCKFPSKLSGLVDISKALLITSAGSLRLAYKRTFFFLNPCNESI